MTLVIGIDPGLTGALALYNDEAVALDVFDTPIHEIGKRRRIDHYAVARIVDDWAGHGAKFVFIEQVGVRPGEGAVGAFTFGQSVGLVLGVCAAHFLSIHMVTPPVWRAAMGVKGDKDESRAAACTLFPKQTHLFARKKDDGRAEAGLIAAYGARRITKEQL